MQMSKYVESMEKTLEVFFARNRNVSVISRNIGQESGSQKKGDYLES